MNGVHDMGGMHNFGPVERELDEPVFHADWEGRAFGLWIVSYGAIGFVEDESRNAIEHTAPDEYLSASYYERVIGALERLGVEKGVFKESELEAVQGGQKPAPERAAARAERPRVLRPDEVAPAMREGGTKHRPDAAKPARFKIGQRVRAKNMNPATHTRLPRYARGKFGVVAMDHGPYVFPDTSALGKGENPGRVYGVRFEARELWGPDAPAQDCVYLDLFETYLEPA